MNKNLKKISELPACNSPTSTDLLVISGNNNSNSFKVSLDTLFKESPVVKFVEDLPASSNSPGKKGTVAISPSYLYVCIDTNSWKRITFETF